jgi:hypothetical protein
VPSVSAFSRLGTGALALAVAAVLASSAGCAGSSSAPGAPTNSAGQLTKSETIKRIDAVCSATDKQLRALPAAKSRQDYQSLLTDFDSTTSLYTSYFAQVEPIVAQSADRDQLTQKWLSVEKADFARQQPLVDQMVQALQAKDDTAVNAAEKKLQTVSVHTEQIVVYLRTYGLTACGTMESGSSGD